MANQIIYTRCLLKRDLLHNGQILNNDGYGVFSMSQDIFSKNIDLAFLKDRLAVSNGAKEGAPIGLIHSYEYCRVPGDYYAMTFEYAREKGKGLRADGKSHRSGNFIKQSIVGKLAGYPCEWFDSSVWNAWKKSENDYYITDANSPELAFLPLVNDKPNAGPINIKSARQFIVGGHREEALKASVGFLLCEYEKPEEERKVLLIKDTPDNVALWVAAIGYGFSAKLAQQITFATNRSRLNSSGINTFLFYSLDSNGKYVRSIDSVGLKQVPLCMVVGFHPLDKFCTVNHPMATSRYVLLDGTSNKAEFQVDISTQTPYFCALVEMGEDIEDFGKEFLPAVDVKNISTKIIGIYECCAYLFDKKHRSEQWEYEDSLKYLDMFIKIITKESTRFVQYALKETMRCYKRFQDIDKSKGYALLKRIEELTKYLHRETEIIQLVDGIIGDSLNDLLGLGEHLKADYQSLMAAGFQNVCGQVVKKHFGDAELVRYTQQFLAASPDTVITVLLLFFDSLESDGVNIDVLEKNKEKFEFVVIGIKRLLPDGEKISSVLNRLVSSRRIYFVIVLTISNGLDEKFKQKWWEIVVKANGGNAIAVCDNLISFKAGDIELIENLLAEQLKKEEKCNSNYISAFQKGINFYGIKPNTGKVFFSAWIQVADVNDVKEIIDTIRGIKLQDNIQKNLFEKVDGKIWNEIWKKRAEINIKPDVDEELDKWGRILGRQSTSHIFKKFNSSFLNEDKPRQAFSYMKEIASYKIIVPNAFLRSDYYKAWVIKAVDFNMAEIHLQMVLLFGINDYCRRQEHANNYINFCLSNVRGKERVALIARLADAATKQMRLLDEDVDYIQEAQLAIGTGLREILPQYYKNRMLEQILKEEPGQKAQELLTDILEEAGKSNSNGFFGTIRSFFGKKENE